MNWIMKSFGVRDYTIGVLVVVIFTIAQQWHGDRVELQKARLVYSNPQIKYVDRVIEKLGPVRIRTVILTEPSGTTKTVIDEDRGEASTETTRENESKPVSLSIALKEPRTDRYLVSVGLNRLTADLDGKAFFIGYGFKNRFDVQVGGIEHDGFSPWALATLRF